MVKTATKTKASSNVRKTSASKSTTKKATPKKTVARKSVSKAQPQTVDYYPNRVPFYTAVAAVMILLLLAVIVSL